jgi:metal-responsive CopG/Arc/MetJ family transcriptional regulator
MKVAVSIPDPIFAEAERLAKRWKMSRSKVYARALGNLVAAHSEDEITRMANELADQMTEEDHAFNRAAARAVFKNSDW